MTAVKGNNSQLLCGDGDSIYLVGATSLRERSRQRTPPVFRIGFACCTVSKGIVCNAPVRDHPAGLNVDNDNFRCLSRTVDAGDQSAPHLKKLSQR